MTLNPTARPSQPDVRTIRVLIVDDSPFIQQLLSSMLDGVSNLQVVGLAANGQEAIRLTTRLKPDVITMDIRMPKMDGLEATRQIMNIQPTPIVIVSNEYETNHNVAFDAIEAGALTVINKPKGLGTHDSEDMRQQLVKTIRTMADVHVIARKDLQALKAGIGPLTAMLHTYFSRPIQVVAIASSTGGPPVLMQIFTALPQDFSIPIVVVQHVLPSFVHGLAEWLGTKSNLKVGVAENGEKIAPGKILIAPGDTHLLVNKSGIIQLEASEPVKGLRPSATRTFESVAKAFGENAVGIILTGMGDDGIDGLETLSKAGAFVVAQDEASSVVYSMPKVAIERGIVDEVLPPDGIIKRLMKLHWHMQSLK